jgi:TonB family protein
MRHLPVAALLLLTAGAALSAPPCFSQTTLTNFRAVVPPGQPADAPPVLRSADAPVHGGKAHLQVNGGNTGFQNMAKAWMQMTGQTPKGVQLPQLTFTIVLEGTRIDVRNTRAVTETATVPNLLAPDRGESLSTTKQQNYTIPSMSTFNYQTQVDDAPRVSAFKLMADGRSLTFLETPPSGLANMHRVRVFFDVQHTNTILSFNAHDPNLVAFTNTCDALGKKLLQDYDAQQAAINAEHDRLQAEADAGRASIAEMEEADKSVTAISVDQSQLIRATGNPPIKPPIARAANISGTVVVNIVVSRAGTIMSLRPVSGPTMLQSAVLEAVRHWTFQPVLIDGKPHKVETNLSVRL